MGGKEARAVSVKLLGGFQVSVGTRTIEEDAWRLRKAASLVKLLALARGHRMHREQAMDLLWPDLGKKAASNNLRQTLHAARRALEPHQVADYRYLNLHEEQLALCPGGRLWVDVHAFEEAAATARRAQDRAAYRVAIELYDGELLPGDRYEEWAEIRRQELRGTFLSLLSELAELYEKRGELAKAIETLQKTVADEPILEEAHVRLMRLYALSGRRGEALSQYERLREALSGRLGAEPNAASAHLREEIATGTLSPTQLTPTVSSSGEEFAEDGRHNLPTQRTSFVGREQEFVEVRRALSETRLLTLTGAGGSGKTRLALEVVKDLVGAYPDGVWLVELAPLSEEALVPQAVAAVLEVQEQPGYSPTDTLINALRQKNTLLVLDNCEHLIDTTSRLTEAFLDSCPRLRMLITSREALNVDGETLWQVDPLSVPDVRDRLTVEELESYESARLFVERALFFERLLYGSSGFALRPDNVSAVAEICRRLEGMPLAIELAAAWVGTLSVEQIYERLKVSLKLLKGGRTLTRRQQTLRGAMDWSYDLLSEHEQTLFGRLSVFAGGWTLEAAGSVGAGDNVEEEEVLELLWRLANKSLVVAEAGMGGVARYRMLETIRQYAREKLEVSGESDEVQGRHAAFFLALAEEAEPELAGPQKRLWVERLEGEHDNLRAALSWVLQRGESGLGLRFGGALWQFWYARGYLSEGLRWLEQALADSDPAPARVKVLEGMGWLVQSQGDSERGIATYEEMLELSRESGDKGSAATALNSLGTLALTRGDNERARALLEENLQVLLQVEEEEGHTATTLKRYHVLALLGFLALNEEGDPTQATALLEESLALAREVRDDLRIGQTLANLGYAALLHGDYERARALSEEAIALAHELGSAGMQILPEALVNLGLAAMGQDKHEQAATAFKEALAIAQEVGIKASAINAMEGMVTLAGAMGEATRAAHLWGAAEALREVTGIALPPGERALHEPYLAAARSRLGESAWEEALAEGRAMTLEEATEYALAKEVEPAVPTTPVPETPSVGAPIGELTSREEEVAVLVAQGFTNLQVSTKLGISERTAGNHVAKILRKLGARSRVQIAGWATDRRLVTPDPD